MGRPGYWRNLIQNQFPVVLLFYPNPSDAVIATEWLPVDRSFCRGHHACNRRVSIGVNLSLMHVIGLKLVGTGLEKLDLLSLCVLGAGAADYHGIVGVILFEKAGVAFQQRLYHLVS